MKKILRFLPGILFALAVLFVFKDFLFPANRVIMSLGGDAAKNLYSYLYHVMYGSGYWFTGMNYPFGEHTVFTDNQPIVSMTLGYINRFAHFSPSTLIGIMHWLIAISFWLGMLYTYKLLTRFGVHSAIAVIVSVCTLILSPQLFRVTGHYPLSYACFLPMLFYWSVLYHDTSRKKYLVYIFILCCCFALAHMYFLAMALLWMAGYCFGYWLTSGQSFKTKLRHALGMVIAISASIVLLQVFMKLTDPVTDRPGLPLSSPAEQPLKMLFTSGYSPVWAAIEEYGLMAPTGIKKDSEGAAYIGIVLDIMMIVGIAVWINAKRKKQQLPFRFDNIWIVLSVSTLLFAMCIGWVWDLPGLKTILRPLHQFRMPERLSWIFYYVASVYAGVVLQYLLSYFYNKGKKILAGSLAVVLLGIWGVEANGNIIHLRKLCWEWPMNYEAFFRPGGGTWTEFFEQHNMKSSDFQCIMVLPYVHVGSEKIWPGEDQSWTINLAYKAGINLHLPIMNVLMSRSSWSQTFDQVKTAAGSIAGKPVLSKCNEKDILVMVFKQSNYQTTPDEDFLTQHSEYIGEFSDCSIYRLSPQKIIAAGTAIRGEMEKIAALQTAQDSIIGNKDWCVIQHFDAANPSYRFAGNGGLPAIKNKDSVILHWTLPDTSRPLLELSAWAKFPPVNHHSNYLTVVYKDASGQQIGTVDALGKYSMDNEKDLWFRVNKYFRPPANCASLDILIMNPELENYEALDELLLRPAETNVISRLPGGTILVNNHVLKR